MTPPPHLSIAVCKIMTWTLSTTPTVGANLISDEFALAFLGNKALTPIDRKLKRPSGSLVSSYGVLRNVSFWHSDVKVHLNFHVFEDLDFDFLIGHPIKALLKDAQN